MPLANFIVSVFLLSSSLAADTNANTSVFESDAFLSNAALTLDDTKHWFGVFGCEWESARFGWRRLHPGSSIPTDRIVDLFRHAQAQEIQCINLVSARLIKNPYAGGQWNLQMIVPLSLLYHFLPDDLVLRSINGVADIGGRS